MNPADRCGLLAPMNTRSDGTLNDRPDPPARRTPPVRPPVRRNPPIRSTLALRAIATAFTLLSFGGMTVYAADHAKPANATLAPTVLPASTPQPTQPATQPGRLRLTPKAQVTVRPPVTTTRVS
jgi:hypothetical protein